MIDTRGDELLAIRCQLGDREAFDALIRRWHEPLWRYLRRLASDDDVAGDLAQETWVRILRRISTLRDASRLRPWMFGIARRVAMDRLRAQYLRRTDDDVLIDDIAAPEIDAGVESDLQALDVGLAALPPRERETLALFYLRELTIEQMAGLLEVPVGTVKSRLFRARELLRRELGLNGASS